MMHSHRALSLPGILACDLSQSCNCDSADVTDETRILTYTGLEQANNSASLVWEVADAGD